MSDSNLQKMAQVLVNYSLEIKKGDVVWQMGEMGGLPLQRAMYEEIIKLGAFSHVTLQPAGFDELLFRYASDKYLATTCPFQLKLSEICNKRVRVEGPTNTRALSAVDPKKAALRSQARLPLLKRTMERAAAGELDWLVTLCPTEALAQEGDMGLLDYEEFVFKAAHLDEDDPVAFWKSQEKRQQKLVDYLDQKKKLHFKTAAGTDLHVEIEGKKWINSCGKRNFPDGEVFSGPGLVEGIVRYTFPAIYNGTIVEDVELIFEKGKVVSAKASKNEAFLHAMINQDEGASYLGEIAIGTNYNIPKFTQNILFDEKIGGTFHAALGAAYPETNCTNQSALHWDMICDLREGGTIEADGELISKDGKFTLQGLEL
ncbi:MAG: Aminopeptidase 2 [Chlamydiales bacterium]|nr:Aminopeptidase 2 [Chlamydiales bacterium]MCH9634898.1 Aminopeptidase 2 [Chlamydiales bacterium]MCH9703433.1 aminopeptidase [Chlamydiota bacterium]